MSSVTVEPMAKKSAKRAAQPAGKAGKPETGRKPMVVQIRGSEAYKAWAESVAEKEGFTVTLLFERALRAFAKQHDHPDPPKR